MERVGIILRSLKLPQGPALQQGIPNLCFQTSLQAWWELSSFYPFTYHRALQPLLCSTSTLSQGTFHTSLPRIWKFLGLAHGHTRHTLAHRVPENHSLKWLTIKALILESFRWSFCKVQVSKTNPWKKICKGSPRKRGILPKFPPATAVSKPLISFKMRLRAPSDSTPL